MILLFKSLTLVSILLSRSDTLIPILFVSSITEFNWLPFTASVEVADTRPAARLVIVRSLPLSPIDTVPIGLLPANVCVLPLIVVDAVPTTVLALEL